VKDSDILSLSSGRQAGRRGEVEGVQSTSEFEVIGTKVEPGNDMRHSKYSSLEPHRITERKSFELADESEGGGKGRG